MHQDSLLSASWIVEMKLGKNVMHRVRSNTKVKLMLKLKSMYCMCNFDKYFSNLLPNLIIKKFTCPLEHSEGMSYNCSTLYSDSRLCMLVCQYKISRCYDLNRRVRESIHPGTASISEYASCS